MTSARSNYERLNVRLHYLLCNYDCVILYEIRLTTKIGQTKLGNETKKEAAQGREKTNKLMEYNESKRRGNKKVI